MPFPSNIPPQMPLPGGGTPPLGGAPPVPPAGPPTKKAAPKKGKKGKAFGFGKPSAK